MAYGKLRAILGFVGMAPKTQKINKSYNQSALGFQTRSHCLAQRRKPISNSEVMETVMTRPK